LHGRASHNTILDSRTRSFPCNAYKRFKNYNINIRTTSDTLPANNSPMILFRSSKNSPGLPKKATPPHWRILRSPSKMTMIYMIYEGGLNKDKDGGACDDGDDDDDDDDDEEEEEEEEENVEAEDEDHEEDKATEEDEDKDKQEDFVNDA